MRKTIYIDDTLIVLDKIVAYKAVKDRLEGDLILIRPVGSDEDMEFSVDDADEAVNIITSAIEGWMPSCWDGVISNDTTTSN